MSKDLYLFPLCAVEIVRGPSTPLWTRKARLGGDEPEKPANGFIGRSRDLLAFQRLLRHERYAVIRGQGGEGKTALAAKFARWVARPHPVAAPAFA